MPPVPADTAVALGAFLTHRGVTTLPAVFAVTWAANMLGAAGVYFAARRYGRRFFATPAGRRLLAPGAIAVIEREYLRFGIFGIFLGRVLPGIRAVVAPFAGLVNLSAPRALIPMGIASAIWYGGVALLGAAIGSQWAQIERMLGSLNRTLGLVALAVAAVIVVVVIVRRRRTARKPLWGALSRAFREPAAAAQDPEEAAREAMRSAALVLLELAYTEEGLTPAERVEVEAHLRMRWGLTPPPASAVTASEHPEREELPGYRRRIVEHFAHERRLALVERLWQVAFAEGPGTAAGDRLLSGAAELLGLTAADVADVERRVRSGGG
ncbi:MAG TPA: TerB family tellurite resistance protein [Gemmatimonadales bacterium]